MGIGQKRNKPCWCGSEKKFKTCHMNREEQTPENPWEAAKKFRNIYSQGICSVPDSYRSECSGKIIKAHTVPKSSSLKAIAKDRHVYGLDADIATIQKNKGKIVCKLIGVNKASTFSGFCSKHDAPIFEKIETEPFLNTHEQCFLLAYRAHAKEAYTKTAANKVNNQIIANADKGMSPEMQKIFQKQKVQLEEGTQAGLKDIQHHKEFFDKYLEDKDYSAVRSVSFKFDVPFPIMVSGGTNPTHDFDGKQVQSLENLAVVPDCWYITSFYDGTSGWVVFSWLEHSHMSCHKVIKTLLDKPKNDIPAYLAQYIFDNFENFFIAPDWWDSLDKEEREKALSIVSNNANRAENLNGNGIKKRQLEAEFPMVSDVEFMNWDLDV